MTDSRGKASRRSGAGSIVGSVYLERGEPVTVLARWTRQPPAAASGSMIWLESPRSAPRNVLVRRTGDNSLVVRPFRGLRRP